MRTISFIICLLLFVTSYGQNVGIGTTSPAARLDIRGTSSALLRLTNTSSASSLVQFYSTSSISPVGSVGAFGGRLSLVEESGGNGIGMVTSGVWRMVVSSNGNIGIGTISPGEKLEVANGNVLLSNGNLDLNVGNILVHNGSLYMNSQYGVQLTGADRPLITRGFDPFNSGNYNGLGRWGLFMEPSKLTFGIPNLVGKAFSFAAYEANSTANEILQVDRVGQVKRPETGNHDLMPVCMGTVGTFGAKVTGTDNFSSIRDCTSGCDGTYAITINNIYFEISKFIAVVTPLSEVSKRYSCHYWAQGGKLMVQTYLEDNENISAFSFVVYRMVY